jgi:SMC interacting uncharacterized protein involved in chromosome segregation
LTVIIDSEKFSVWEEVHQRSSEQLTTAFTAVYKEATEAVQAYLNPSPKKRRVDEEALSSVFQQKAIGYNASVSTLRAYIKECEGQIDRLRSQKDDLLNELEENQLKILQVEEEAADDVLRLENEKRGKRNETFEDQCDKEGEATQAAGRGFENECAPNLC